MDVVLGWVFVLIFLSKIILSTSDYEVKYGRFRVLRQHPKIRQCADDVLKENQYIGGRISDQTGVCEGLSPSVWRNQTTEPGYGHVKKTYVQENFEPPIGLGQKANVDYSWTIPGIMDAGARVDVHITWPRTESVNNMCIRFSEETNAFPMFEMSLHGYYSGAAFREVFRYAEFWDNYDKEPLPAEFDSVELPKELKISFIATKNNSLQVLVDDDVIKTIKLSVVRVEYLRQLTGYCFFTNSAGSGFLLRRFEYTEG